MNPRLRKTLLALTVVVAVVSLTLNFILYFSLRRSNDRAEQWKTAHERLAREQIHLKKQLENRLPLPSPKDDASSPTLPMPRSDQPTANLPRSSKSLAEPSTQFHEDSNIDRDLYYEDVRNLMAEALAADFPELDLSQSELQELTGVVISFRESMEDLSYTQRTSDNVATINSLMQRRDQALLDFERITGMSLNEFMRRAPAEGSIDHE